MNPGEEYRGKVALVTGAARGIGLGIAQRLGEAGARVLIADVNSEGGTAAVDGLHARGLAVDYIKVDLSAPGGPAAMVETAVRLAGSVDVLINNARAGARLSLLAESEQDWDLALDVGLKAAFFASQAVIKLMAGKGGCSIVNVSSVAGVLVTNESAAYHATKAGLVQLTRYLAVAAGPQHARVNCILPGLIVQDEHRARFEAADNDAYRQVATFYQPLGAAGSEADVAEAVLFLCSARARYISGACLAIDGGATAQDQFGMLLRWPGIIPNK